MTVVANSSQLAVEPTITLAQASAPPAEIKRVEPTQIEPDPEEVGETLASLEFVPYLNQIFQSLDVRPAPSDSAEPDGPVPFYFDMSDVAEQITSAENSGDLQTLDTLLASSLAALQSDRQAGRLAGDTVDNVAREILFLQTKLDLLGYKLDGYLGEDRDLPYYQQYFLQDLAELPAQLSALHNAVIGGRGTVIEQAPGTELEFPALQSFRPEAPHAFWQNAAA